VTAVARQVQIVEVGPRDGLQNEDRVVSTAKKVAYIERLVAAGLGRIEAVSFAHPQRVPQMADAEQVMAAVPREPGVSYIGLVLNERGLDRALDTGVDEINVVVVATETFSERNQGMSLAASIRSAERITERARASGLQVTVTIAAAFGCPFEGEVSVDHVADVVRRCTGGGATEIALADTIGVAVPRDVERLVTRVQDDVAVPLRVHLHNTRNTGYANALAAVAAGVRVLDASSGGIGGCPFAPAATGNIATEDLAYLLERSGVETGIRRRALLDASAHIEAALHRQNPALLGRAGWFPPGK